MAENGKKISFGFSKLVKPKVAIISNKKDVKSDENIQFIDCLEDKSIKVINEAPKKDNILVIPLPKGSVLSGKRRELLHKILNSTHSDNDQDNTTSVNVSTNPNSDNPSKPETLDEIAAREIIEDLKKAKETESSTDNFTVPLIADETTGKESTVDDYESIPIDKFGIAMLRGMGWAPGKGVGKNEKVVPTKQPVLRPKGLGLGADKVMKQEKTNTTTQPLKLVKGSFVRIIAGVHKDMFGEIIAFDEESGRLIVKMALGSNVLTFNEFMVELVSKDDFHKNSKVINVKKYEEYKKKEVSLSSLEKRSENDKKSKTESSNNVSNLSDDSSNDMKSKIKSDDKQKSVIKNRKSLTPEISRDKYRSYENSRNRSKARSSSQSSVERDNSSRRKYRSPSEDRKLSRKYEHTSRKDSKRRRSSSTESSTVSLSRDSSYSSKKTKGRYKDNLSSSDCSSDYEKQDKHSNNYKKKSKRHKEKKKSRRRSRSVSYDRKRGHSKKHKKSKY